MGGAGELQKIPDYTSCFCPFSIIVLLLKRSPLHTVARFSVDMRF